MTLDAVSDMKVVDVDSHLTEPADLWTSRVSSKDRDRVPRKVRDEDGRDTWYFDGDHVFARPAGASSVIRADGSKQSFWDWNVQAGLQWDEVHPGAYDVSARLDVLDKMGIWRRSYTPIPPVSEPTSWPRSVGFPTCWRGSNTRSWNRDTTERPSRARPRRSGTMPTPASGSRKSHPCVS